MCEIFMRTWLFWLIWNKKIYSKTLPKSKVSNPTSILRKILLRNSLCTTLFTLTPSFLVIYSTCCIYRSNCVCTCKELFLIFLPIDQSLLRCYIYRSKWLLFGSPIQSKISSSFFIKFNFVAFFTCLASSNFNTITCL